MLQALRAIHVSLVALKFEDGFAEKLALASEIRKELPGAVATQTELLVATHTLPKAVRAWLRDNDNEAIVSVTLTIAAASLACEDTNTIHHNISDDDEGSGFRKMALLPQRLYAFADQEFGNNPDDLNDGLMLPWAATEVIEGLHKKGKNWSFWLDWYQGFLGGKPLDWELQRRVALINDDVWDAGPEAVAAEIERIRSLFELEQEIANLKEQLAIVQDTPATALIGDNGGPPLEDAPARAFQTDLALIWKQVEELEEEIAKPSPSPSQLGKIAKALWDISRRMAAYCGSIADGMIREGSKEMAKAGAKWTAGATAVTVTAQTESVQSVATAIWAFVKTLPPG
ncbi:hypothetical protein OL67_002326 [Phaeobacter piscinae]|nr:hypothetical protein OL67_002326 [Phaeobacter piscinae]